MRRSIWIALAIVIAVVTPLPVGAKHAAHAQAVKDPVVTQSTPVAPPVVVVQPAGGAPVTSTTVVETGSFLSGLIDWIRLAFGAALATALVALALRVLNFFGVKTTDALKAQLQAIIVNGINYGAAKAQTQVGKLTADGKFSVDVKNQVIADAIIYAQANGAAIMKELGVDPKSGEAVKAIDARIQSAIIDPLTPTNPALAPDNVVPTPVVVVAAAAKA